MDNVDVTQIGVAGCGVMGSGIAQSAAMAGYRVVLYGRSALAVGKSLEQVKSSLVKLHEKGILAETPETVLGRISPTVNLHPFSSCGLAIEAVTEDQELKSWLLRELAAIIPESAILASTTSSLSVTELGRASGIPERFIGMHFMNPVPLMGVVELIFGEQSSAETIALAEQIIIALGKVFVRSNDRPGFIISRLLCVLINEAFEMLREEVADAEEIDAAMKLGANHPMGPLALSDLIGLDVIKSVLEILSNGIGSHKYLPSPLLCDYVAQGRFGKKSGQGVYDYRSV